MNNSSVSMLLTFGGIGLCAVIGAIAKEAFAVFLSGFVLFGGMLVAGVVFHFCGMPATASVLAVAGIVGLMGSTILAAHP